jgi:hypothetical protein
MRPPRALGLVLCREFVVNVGEGSYTLNGLFHALYFDSWPAASPPIMIYAALTGGRGEGTMELEVQRADTEASIDRHSTWAAFADPDVVIPHRVILKRCVFPAPGRYSFTLRFDGQQIANRMIDVFQARGRV